MKKLVTLASATVLMVAAGQASAIGATVSNAADILAVPGTAIGAGTGDFDPGTGVLTFDLTTTIDLGYATAVVESSGSLMNGSPGTGSSTVNSCTGLDIVCSGQSVGATSPIPITEDLNMAAGTTSTFTIAANDATSANTWTITVEADGGPGPGPTGPGPGTGVIPIPAAAWLFGSALLGLVGVRRRKS